MMLAVHHGASYPMACNCLTIVMPIPFSAKLAMLAASGTAASAQEDINFKVANIDHVSVHVGNLQKSIDFYQKMFDFAVVSQAEEGGVQIVRLGNTKTLVYLKVGASPTRLAQLR